MTTDGATITWDDLVTEFAPALVSFARARGIRAAEDLVQEVLVIAVERLSEFDGDRASLRSWLFSVTYRRIADEHRRFYRRPEVLVADHAPNAEAANNVDEVVIQEDSASEAFAALEVLEARERSVLEMRIIDEASPAEVASALGISTGNVRVIQARALVKIRKHLMTRDTGRSMGPVGLLITFMRYFGSGLPSDDVTVHSWVEQLRSTGSGTSIVGASSTTASAAVGSAAGTAATTSLGMIAGSAVKVGLVVSLAAAPVVVGGDAAEVSLVPPAGAIVVTETSGDLSVPSVDDQGGAPTDPADPEAPVLPPGDVTTIDPPSRPEPPASREEGVPDQDAEPTVETGVADPSAEGGEAPPGESNGSTEEAVVQPLVGETVQPLVEETVEPLVNDVVVPLVEETVEWVVEDVVEPVVEETVEIVETLVEDVVDPLLDDVIGRLLLGEKGLLGG